MIPWETVPGQQIPVLRSVPRSGGSLERETERRGKIPGERLGAWASLSMNLRSGRTQGKGGEPSGGPHCCLTLPGHGVAWNWAGLLGGCHPALWEEIPAPGEPDRAS